MIDDKDIDTILAYGLRGVIVEVLDNLLQIAQDEKTQKEYIDMCGKILDLMRTSVEKEWYGN